MRVRIERKWQDCWIGVYWARSDDRLDVWVCLIPCFPVHITRRS